MCNFAPFFDNTNMRKLFYSAFVAALTILVAGCTKEDSSVITPTSDCYISNITLGTMYRTVKEGEREYETSFVGSVYPISIDQVACVITNTKPLPTRTNLTIVPLTITAKGSVIFAQKPEDYPTVQPEGWYSYTTGGGTIDFRKPVLFRVYATDGSGHREYTMTLTVREHEEGSYTWEPMTTNVLQGRGDRQALPWQEGFLLLSADGDGKIHKTTFANETWSNDVLCTGADGAQVASMIQFNNKLWMNTTTGAVINSEDGQTWNAVSQTEAGDEVTLLTASEKLLYARIHNASATPTDWIASSADGQTWTALVLESGKDISQFPTTAAALSFKIGSTPYVLVAGKNADEKTTVWVRHEQENESWALLDAEKGSELTWQDGMTLVRYNNSIIALGGSQTETYSSPDNGLTWKQLKTLTLPVTDAHFTATAVDNYIYIFAGENVQRAIVN